MEWTRDAISPRRGPGSRPSRSDARSATSRSSTAARATRPGSTSRRRRRAREPRRASTTPHGLHGHTHVPLAFREDDGRIGRSPAPPTSRPGARRPARAAQPGQRRPAARRRPDGRATSSSIPTRRGAPGIGSPTTSARSRRPMPSGGLPARLGRRLGLRRLRRRVDDRRPAAAPGPQARRPARPGRAPHAPYFRYTGPGQLTAKEAASVPTTPTGARLRRGSRAIVARPAAAPGGGDRRAPVEEEGAGDLQLRRDQLVRLRDRGDHPRVHPRRRRRRRHRRSRLRGQHRDRRPARRSWRSATARSASPTRPAAARTRSRRRTSAGSRRSSRRRALLIDYNLTVGRVDVVGGRADRLGRSRALRPAGRHRGASRIGLITLANLRGLREAGNIFAVPTYLFLFSALLMIAHRGVPDHRARGGRTSRHRPRSSRRRASRPRRRRRPAPARVRVRRRGPDRHGGDRDRRPGVQAAGAEERRDDPDGHGGPPRRPVRRHHVPGHELRDLPDGGARSRRSSPRSPGRVRRLDRVLPVPGVHGAAPVPRREHLASRRSRGSPRSSPRTASSRASSRSAATGSRSRRDHPAGRHRRRPSWSPPAATPTR